MPHIVIKSISGPSKEEYLKAAEQIAEIINKTLGKPKEYISVAVEEYTYNEWKAVYNDCIKDKDGLLIKPKYTM